MLCIAIVRSKIGRCVGRVSAALVRDDRVSLRRSVSAPELWLAARRALRSRALTFRRFTCTPSLGQVSRPGCWLRSRASIVGLTTYQREKAGRGNPINPPKPTSVISPAGCPGGRLHARASRVGDHSRSSLPRSSTQSPARFAIASAARIRQPGSRPSQSTRIV